VIFVESRIEGEIRKKKDMITVILMYAVLAASFTFSKAAIAYATPYFLVGFRMLMGGALFVGFQAVADKKRLAIKKEDIGLFFYVALFHVYLSYVCEFWALQYISSSKEVIIYSITPFITAILAFFLASEKLSFKKIVGMIIGFAGIVPLIVLQDDIREASMEILSVSFPEMILFVAVFSGAYAWFPLKKLIVKGYSLPVINGFTMLIGGTGAMLTSFASEGLFAEHVFDLWPFLFYTTMLVIFSNIIFYSLYCWHLKKFSFTILSFAGFLCPVFGAFFAWIFLGEKIMWNHFAALTMVCISLYVFYKEELSLVRGACLPKL
jgi:drug/metabolite transporter (DMT)-like permease